MDNSRAYNYDSAAANSSTSLNSATPLGNSNGASWLPRRGKGSISNSFQHTRGQSTGVDTYRLNNAPFGTNALEADPYEHELPSSRPQTTKKGRKCLSLRGSTNLGCIALMVLIIIAGAAVYPIYNFIKNKNAATAKAALGSTTNATNGALPSMPGRFTLIDPDTPDSAKTKTSYGTGESWTLVFSDEFEKEGRTFYPGDDPFWQAEDLHYWQTNDQEWYDPEAVTTQNGSLRITLSKESDVPDPNVNHGMTLKGGMMNSWNKLCFTGGLIEASVKLPGFNNIPGLWPAVWTFGNLGRAGYGASTHGMWPYTYDSCDVGTLTNQTLNNLPLAALHGGSGNSRISSLPGQRLSRCTCPGESHPGPKHPDGSYVGRSSPEIDLFESQHKINPDGTQSGTASQSGQWAPFNVGYHFNHTEGFYSVANPAITKENTYSGGPQQQASSFVTDNNLQCYQNSPDPCFATYGYEYKPGFASNGSYITWVNDGKEAWSIKGDALGPDAVMGISARPIPQEPMYIIANLGQSPGFVADIDYKHLIYPAIMEIDWIRVYQPSNAINIGCDPPDFPTAAYIQKYIQAYTDVNLTVWDDQVGQNGYGKTFPKNNMVDKCT